MSILASALVNLKKNLYKELSNRRSTKRHPSTISVKNKTYKQMVTNY